ncbi:MAG: response regulator transcription factor [Bacteroidota bacterium]|nr:response regulator transcription factor [Bacteroidota bacterium]
MPIKILIVDDHAIVRKGLIQILTESYPDALLFEAINSEEVYKLLKLHNWDIILLDISLPGRNGIDLLKQLRSDGIKVPILILSMHDEEQYAIRVLKAGASGYINKNMATEELTLAIQKLLDGKKYISEFVANQLLEKPQVENEKNILQLLSDRELQVFVHLSKGKSVSEIANEISLSVNTISTYRSRILEKLGLNNNVDIMKFAIENGIQ